MKKTSILNFSTGYTSYILNADYFGFVFNIKKRGDMKNQRQPEVFMQSDSIKTHLTKLFSKIFKSCGYDEKYGRVDYAKPSDSGQFRCEGCLPAAATSEQDPCVIAHRIAEEVNNLKIFQDISIGGSGLITIRVADAYLASFLGKLQQDKRLGVPISSPPKKVVVDFGGPNVAKPMHVGHLRSTIIGDCLQRLMRFMGDSVTSDIHLGDWGLQMGMLIKELEQKNPNLSYFDPSFSSDYPETSPVTIAELAKLYSAASKRCMSNADDLAKAHRATVDLQNKRRGFYALWRHFVGVSEKALRRDFDELGVRFDQWFSERR